MPWIDACSTDGIDAEDVIRFDHGGLTLAIFCNHENGHFCTAGPCTHEDVHLAGGSVMKNTIECPKHSSIFGFTSGVVETPPARDNLQSHATKVEGGRAMIDL